MPNYTKKLGIRLLEGSDRFVDTSFNNILNDMDSKLVGISHLSSCAHFAVWGANVAYVSGDVVRTPYLKSGQYLECMASGTSGSSVPQYNIDGTNFTDGTVSWVVRSFSSAVRNIITEWASGVSYSVGSLVLYGNALYRAKMLHTSTAFSLDVGKWQEVYASVRIWKANVFYDINDSVLYEDVLYRCISANSRTTFNPSDWVMVNNLSPVADWASSTVYYKNQLVVHQGALYRATSSHISDSTFSVDYLANQWDMVKANVSIWQSGFDYFVDDVVFCDNTCYICVAQHTSSANIAQDMVNWNILIRNSAYLQDWTPNAFFDVGQVVIYKGNLYRCLTSNTDATFTNSNWELVVQFLSLWQTNTTYSVGAVVLHDSKLYQCDTLHTSDASSFYNDRGLWTEISRTTIEDWAQNFPYTVGDMCTYNQKIFKCTVSHISGTTFTDTYFVELSPNYLYNWSNGTNYHINDVVIYGRALYRCLSNHLSSNFSADSAYWESLTSITSWISGWTYSAGDFVTNGSDPYIYRCIKGHVSSSSFSSDEFTRWIKVGSDNILLEWYPNTVYDKYQLVHVDRVLYRANARHTSSTSFANDASKWDLIYANISTYVNGAYYLAGSLVIYGRILYRCVKSYQSTTAYLDKTKWEIIGGSSYISNWETNKDYVVNDCVINNGFLYSCVLKHNSGSVFSDTNWINLSRTTILDWASNTKYEINQVVFYKDSIYRCLVATNGDSKFISNNWELLCSKYPDLIVYNWKAAKDYLKGIIVIYNRSLYWCARNHRSGANFRYDLSQGLWVALTDNASGGGATNYVQLSSGDIVAPKTFDITIENNKTFCFPPAEILKFKPGTQNVVNNLSSFNFSDANLYSVDGISADVNNFVVFDGSAKLNTIYTYKTDTTTVLNSSYVHLSENIDPSDYKDVFSLDVKPSAMLLVIKSNGEVWGYADDGQGGI